MNYRWEPYVLPDLATDKLGDMPTDAARFLQIRAAATHPQQEPAFSRQEEIWRAIDACMDPELRLYACRDERARIIGAMTLDITPRKDSAVWLDRLAVDPHYRREYGIGRAALNFATGEVAALGDGRQDLVGNAVLASTSFYQRYGFVVTDQRGPYDAIRGKIEEISRLTAR